MTAAGDALALALSRPAALGVGRLICLDGPSGSGKSTLAREIARLTPATIVHTDDLCPGWDGIPAMTGIISELLAPLAAGRPSTYRRYDWITETLAEAVVIQPGPLLVLEGVAAGSRPWSELTATLVWLDADEMVRQQRALARDGESFREYWESWAAAEDVLFATEDVRARADLVLDTTG